MFAENQYKDERCQSLRIALQNWQSQRTAGEKSNGRANCFLGAARYQPNHQRPAANHSGIRTMPASAVESTTRSAVSVSRSYNRTSTIGKTAAGIAACNINTCLRSV